MLTLPPVCSPDGSHSGAHVQGHALSFAYCVTCGSRDPIVCINVQSFPCRVLQRVSFARELLRQLLKTSVRGKRVGLAASSLSCPAAPVPSLRRGHTTSVAVASSESRDKAGRAPPFFSSKLLRLLQVLLIYMYVLEAARRRLRSRRWRGPVWGQTQAPAGGGLTDPSPTRSLRSRERSVSLFTYRDLRLLPATSRRVRREGLARVFVRRPRLSHFQVIVRSVSLFLLISDWSLLALGTVI